MSSTRDTIAISLMIVLLFGAVCLYLYTRLQQSEQKISIMEGMLLDMKMATDMTVKHIHSQDDNMMSSLFNYSSTPAPNSSPILASTALQGDSEQHTLETIPEITSEEELYKNVLNEVHASMNNGQLDKEDHSAITESAADSAHSQTHAFEMTNLSGAQPSTFVSQADDSIHTITTHVNYDSMTLKELKKLAAQRKINGANEMKRTDIVTKLRRLDRVKSSDVPLSDGVFGTGESSGVEHSVPYTGIIAEVAI
jgi:hypothetical protein